MLPKKYGESFSCSVLQKYRVLLVFSRCKFVHKCRMTPKIILFFPVINKQQRRNTWLNRLDNGHHKRSKIFPSWYYHADCTDKNTLFISANIKGITFKLNIVFLENHQGWSCCMHLIRFKDWYQVYAFILLTSLVILHKRLTCPVLSMQETPCNSIDGSSKQSDPTSWSGNIARSGNCCLCTAWNLTFTQCIVSSNIASVFKSLLLALDFRV